MTDTLHGSSRFVWLVTAFGWLGWLLVAAFAYILAIRPDPVVLESCTPVKILKTQGQP